MRRRKEVKLKETQFSRQYSIEIDGFVIERGDEFKVRGEHGNKFKFDSFVTNSKTGAQWVDCFETYRGQSGCYRSFKLEAVKRIPKRRSSGKVRRRKLDTAS